MKYNSPEKINKSMTIKQVLNLDDSLSEVFMGFGMFCIFCEMGNQESLEQACMVHGIDMDLLLKKLNECYEKNHK